MTWWHLKHRDNRVVGPFKLAIEVQSAQIEGDVLELKIIKPRHWRYIPGQYLQLCCPSISASEWRSFTITSAPEDPFISVHIKRAGQWTAALHEVFHTAQLTHTPQTKQNSTCMEKTELKPPASVLVFAHSSSVSDSFTSSGSSCAQHVISAGGADTNQHLVPLGCQQQPEQVTELVVSSRAVSNAVSDRRVAQTAEHHLYRPGDAQVQRQQGTAGTTAAADGMLKPHGSSTSLSSLDSSSSSSGYHRHPESRPQQVVVTASQQTAVTTCHASQQLAQLAPVVYIDGPYGSQTQQFDKYEVLVLIGTGIGITPMASVLRHLMHQLVKAKGANGVRCSWGMRQRKKRPTRVYVHWIARDITSMTWFYNLIAAIAALDDQDIFTMNVHITSSGPVICDSACTASNMTENFQATTFANNKLGPASEKGVKFTYGVRPNMPAHLAEIQSAHLGTKVGVFFCGNKGLSKDLQQTCGELNAQTVHYTGSALQSSKGCVMEFHSETL